MKAIILAGGENTRLYPLVNSCQRLLLPFLNKPFLQSQIDSLRRHGIREIGLAVTPEQAEAVTAHFGTGEKLGITMVCSSSSVPRGPAGSLKLFESFIGSDPFLAIHADTYLGTVDLKNLIAAHHKRNSIATLGMYVEESRRSAMENVLVSKDGQVERFEIIHPSKEKRRHRRFGGIYVFEAKVLEHIAAEGYVDIKEQLIPELCKVGHKVSSTALEGFHASIDGPEIYCRIQQDILRQGLMPGNEYTERAAEVWVGEGTEISPSAYILGPVLIGKNCVIHGQAQIIGPTIIGHAVHVGDRTLVRESVLWDDCRVESQARVEYSLVGSQEVPAGHLVRDSLVMTEHGPTRLDLKGESRTQSVGVNHAVHLPRPHWGSILLKRAIDIAISSVVLTLLSPILLLIAIAVKLDSKGPIFFVQRRCGRGGKEFPMYKFRTMVNGADRLQRELQAKKSVDGPVFKIFDDPRVTSLGGFLRRNSLDELPQLVNVLKGEMSLVGPRPLVMDEMRLSPSWRDIRLSVKPGITGIWQVNGRSQTSFHDWIRHDVAYVKGWSLWLDVKILVKTAKWVLARAGAC